MSLKVLLVDDSQQFRAASRQSLELAGHSVACSGSGEQALKLINRDVGVLITDVRMAGMDGFALMGHARAIDPDLPVVMITGHGDVSMAVRAIQDGAYDFIEKPFPAELLVETVRRALERRELVMENRRLRQELAGQGDGAIIGRSPAIERLRQAIASIAGTDADVLVFGETGTGKELVARALHAQSARKDHHFVALNCGAMPETLFESELFGHRAGTFTGAQKARVGRIEFAHRGTLYLDEIESMPLALQVKILRVLQERVVEPLGSNEQVPVDLRVVAATKEDLLKASRDGRFREDLYYRLNVVGIRIPPLRERPEDIALLLQHFMLLAERRYGREAPKLTPDLMSRLTAYRWPGNIRELKNTADRLVLGFDDGLAVPGAETQGSGRSLPERLDLFEKSVIEMELAAQRGNVRQTIEALGIPRKTFYDKAHRLGIVVDDFR